MWTLNDRILGPLTSASGVTFGSLLCHYYVINKSLIRPLNDPIMDPIMDPLRDPLWRGPYPLGQGVYPLIGHIGGIWGGTPDPSDGVIRGYPIMDPIMDPFGVVNKYLINDIINDLLMTLLTTPDLRIRGPQIRRPWIWTPMDLDPLTP